jgi:molybdopterin-guanine dinucleotide biosynthesis protein B
MAVRRLDGLGYHRRMVMKVFGIAGWSGSGKTTLLERLIPQLTARGLKVSVIKHAHHGFDIDRPGKDSYRHREAGAMEVLLSCGDRWALMHERREEPEPTLSELIGHLSPCDLVLIEGFKQEPVPKLEVYRPENGKPPLFPERDDIVAVATDAGIETNVPKLPLNDYVAIAEFVMKTLDLQERPC